MVEESKALEGYKITEVGVIPDDWEVRKLSEICNLSNQKYNPQKSADNFPCIELEHISPETGKLLGTTNSLDQLSMKNYFFKGDTLLGKLRPYLKKYLYAYFDGVCSTEIWVLRPQNGTEDRFLYYMIQSEKVIDACNKSSGTKMPRAEWKVVQDTIILLPPLHEQKAIAEALSDTDYLIQSVEKLIDKKKKIKQGVMQQLLTGKKRLPGFGGEWDVKRLGEFAEFYSGGTPTSTNSHYYGGSIPWITSGDLNQHRIKEVNGRITKLGLEKSSAKMVSSGTLLVALYGATAGVAALSNIDAAINQAVLAIIPNKDNDPIFLYYKITYLKTWIIKTYTQGGQPNLSGSIMKLIEISVPHLNEQKAIAQVLSDMDAEIEGLEEKLEKYKTIKQGMMQELLTGRIRLI